MPHVTHHCFNARLHSSSEMQSKTQCSDDANKTNTETKVKLKQNYRVAAGLVGVFGEREEGQPWNKRLSHAK